MEIYNRGVLVKKMKRFFVKKGRSLFIALRGINIEGEGESIYVDEIYMPLLTISFEGRILFIDLAWKGGFLTIILHGKFPFIYIGRGEASFEEEP